MLLALERARANVRYVVCWAAALFVVALPALPSLQSTRRHSTRVGAPQGDAIVSLPDAWWTSTLVMLAAWIALGQRPRRQVRLGHRRDSSCARSQPCVPRSRGIAPAALASRPLRGASRHARPVGLGDDRRGARVGSADDRRRAPSLVRTLDPDELDRVLIHEWAHVQRRDDLVNVAADRRPHRSPDGIRRSGGSIVVCTSNVRSPATR